MRAQVLAAQVESERGVVVAGEDRGHVVLDDEGITDGVADRVPERVQRDSMP